MIESCFIYVFILLSPFDDDSNKKIKNMLYSLIVSSVL